MDNMIPQADLDRLLMIASAHGLLYASNPPAVYTHIPISLHPTSFSKSGFQDLIRKTPLNNHLIFSISQNLEYLTQALREVCEVDDFTRKLFEISKKAHQSPFYQDITLGLIRNDFMFDKDAHKFFQVEYNTISVSFVSLGTKIVDFHRQAVKCFSEVIGYEGGLPLENDPLLKYSQAFQLAYEMYGNKGSVLFVVTENEKNLFDQCYIELELWRNW